MRALIRRISGSWVVVPALVLLLGFGVGFLLTQLVSTGDGGGKQASAPAPKPTGKPADSGRGRSFLARVIPPPAGSLRGARPPAGLARLVRSMSLEKKVAQLMLVGFDGQDATAPIFGELRGRPYGGLMLERRNYRDPQQFATLTAELRAQARRARATQPLLGAAQLGGEWNALPALPPALAPADLGDFTQAATVARTTARTFRRFGLNTILGPSLEVGAVDGGAMGTRAFSDEPGQVAAYGQAVVKGYARARLMAAPGRFPGLGAAAIPPEDGPPNVGLSLNELRARDLVPYRAVIRAGVPAIVVGHGLYATDDFVVPASQSKALAQNLLRGQLGFRGVAIADDLTLPAITTTTGVPAAALRSLRAGLDMVYVPGPPALVRQTYASLLASARRGSLPRGRIDEAVTRVLVSKSDLRLLR